MKYSTKAIFFKWLLFLLVSSTMVSCQQTKSAPEKQKIVVYKTASKSLKWLNNKFVHKKVSCCKGSPSRKKLFMDKAEK
jgi:hypothetical protein